MISKLCLILVFVPIIIFCYMSYRQFKKARTPISFLQFGKGYQSSSFFATLLASNSSLSGALFLIAFYGMLYGPSIFLWVFIFWFSTQIMSNYTIKWVDSLYPQFIERRGTLHEFLGLLFGQNQGVRVVAGKISMFSYIGLLASEIVIGYAIVSAFVPGTTKVIGSLSLLPGITILVLLGIVAAYTALAGFRGVVMTDVFQLSLIIFMLLGIAWYIESKILLIALIVLALLVVGAFLFFRKNHGQVVSTDLTIKPVNELHIRDVLRDLPFRWPAFLAFAVIVLVWLFSSREIGHPIQIADVINPIKDPPLRFFIFFIVANILFWLVWWPAAMDQWHRCAATTNSKVSRHWLLGTLGVLPTFYLGLLSLTFLFAGAAVAKANPEIMDPLAGFLGLLWDGNNPSSKAVVGVFPFIIVAAGILAAMISTVDTYLIVATQTWVADVREARKSGRTLHDIEVDGKDHHEMMPMLRKTVVAIFIWSSVLAFPILVLGIDLFATIYFFFSGMLVLAGVLLVGFFIKDKERRNRMGGAAKQAMCVGMAYVVATNIPIITMLQLTLGGTISGDAWYCQYNNWYYAVYINPVLAMFVTVLFTLFNKSKSKGNSGL